MSFVSWVRKYWVSVWFINVPTACGIGISNTTCYKSDCGQAKHDFELFFFLSCYDFKSNIKVLINKLQLPNKTQKTDNKIQIQKKVSCHDVRNRIPPKRIYWFSWNSLCILSRSEDRTTSKFLTPIFYSLEPLLYGKFFAGTASFIRYYLPLACLLSKGKHVYLNKQWVSHCYWFVVLTCHCVTIKLST